MPFEYVFKEKLTGLVMNRLDMGGRGVREIKDL